MKNTNIRNTTGMVTTRNNRYVDDKNEKITCNLHIGEHLKQIRGLDCFKTAYDFKVVGEYTHHYLIEIIYSEGKTPEYRNLIRTSVSKADIYCGNVSLIKNDGSRVFGRRKWLCKIERDVL